MVMPGSRMDKITERNIMYIFKETSALVVLCISYCVVRYGFFSKNLFVVHFVVYETFFAMHHLVQTILSIQ